MHTLVHNHHIYFLLYFYNAYIQDILFWLSEPPDIKDNSAQLLPQMFTTLTFHLPQPLHPYLLIHPWKIVSLWPPHWILLLYTTWPQSSSMMPIKPPQSSLPAPTPCIYPYSILKPWPNFHSYFTLRCFQHLIPYSNVFLFCTQMFLLFPTVFLHSSVFPTPMFLKSSCSIPFQVHALMFSDVFPIFIDAEPFQSYYGFIIIMDPFSETSQSQKHHELFITYILPFIYYSIDICPLLYKRFSNSVV